MTGDARRMVRGVVICIGSVSVWLGAASCGDDPFNIDWPENRDTVLLYSLARPEFNLVSGYNFNRRSRVRVEAAGAAGTWDVALGTEEDRLVLLPPAALGVSASARIAPLSGIPFDDVRDAPTDTEAYVSDRSVPVAVGTIYVVQTNDIPGPFGQTCVYFAKLEPLNVDVERGELTFVFASSPICNDSRLVPPGS